MSEIALTNLLKAALGGYIIGSIPTAYWFCLAFYRIDIFQFGSKNMGATNVHRVLGKGPFSMVLVFDILKGFFAVLFATWLATSSEEIMQMKLVAGGAAVLGHTLSFWVGFRGGKGVATGLGVFLGLAPVSSIITMFIFLVALIFSGMVSIGSIAASCSLPFLIHRLGEGGDWNTGLTVFSVVLAVFIVFRHRANISRIAAGKEHKLE